MLSAVSPAFPALQTPGSQPAVSPAPSPKPVPLTTAGAPWTAAELPALEHDLSAILRAPPLRGAHAGLLVLETGSGRVLYEHNADDDFTPASTLKLVTGATALQQLGRDFRFHTAILAGAVPENGVVSGDLILRGGGDPLLRRSDLQAAAASLVAGGLKAVTGSLICDASYFDDEPFREGWAWDDLTQYYGVAPSALTLGESNTSATVTAAASSDGPLGESVSPDPAIRAGTVLREALAGGGVTIADPPKTGLTPPGATVLWQHDGEPLTLLLADFWYPSDNLVGETLTKSLGIARAGLPGKTAPGIAVEIEFLKRIGVDPATVSVVDGSGLSRYNAVTPRALVKLLQYEWSSPNRDDVLNALPVSGSRGSLRKEFTAPDLARRIYAKSGSMTNVANLAGYLATNRHGSVTFALLLDNALGDDAGIDAVRSRVFARLIGD